MSKERFTADADTIELMKKSVISTPRNYVGLPTEVADIYRAAASLTARYPERRFTPDGHLVGSIGEVVAAEALGLTLHKPGNPGHDAIDVAGRQVQIKMTAGRHVAMYADCDRLVVLQIADAEWAEIVYDGSGASAWKQAGKAGKNSQRVISIYRLRKIAAEDPQ